MGCNWQPSVAEMGEGGGGRQAVQEAEGCGKKRQPGGKMPKCPVPPSDSGRKVGGTW